MKTDAIDILLVEDNPADAEHTRIVLEREKHVFVILSIAKDPWMSG